VHDTVVNQLLSKIDGVNALNNILVIGMTNRKDMIDPALLRPGRLEVHVEISLPDEKGRVQIFNIHMKKMRDSGMLDPEVSVEWLASLTKNFSGAEIEGVVVAASSLALAEGVNMKTAKAMDLTGKNIHVTRSHFQRALDDVTPAFGVDEDELKHYRETPLLDYGEAFQKIMTTGRTFVDHLRNSQHTRIRSVLLEGPLGSGKTSIAAELAATSGFPFVKIISAESLMGMSEQRKCDAILKVFEDAYKSPLSLIILDSIENLLEYISVGPRFSQAVLQTLLVLIKRKPPTAPRKLMVLATTSQAKFLSSLGITQSFNVVVPVPALTSAEQVASVLQAFRLPSSSMDIQTIARNCYLPIAIKPLLEVADVSQDNQTVVTPERFAQCLSDSGFDVTSPSARAVGTSAAAASAYGPRNRRHDDDDDDDM
jgi:vesicle-fusing ATPase